MHNFSVWGSPATCTMLGMRGSGLPIASWSAVMLSSPSFTALYRLT
jgi:hypothetical protein